MARMVNEEEKPAVMLRLRADTLATDVSAPAFCLILYEFFHDMWPKCDGFFTLKTSVY